jgi:hypothetical protein
MENIRFHSAYTDAAGNRHAQFEWGALRGEVTLDPKRGIVNVEAARLSREQEVAIKRAWRVAPENGQPQAH